MLALIEIALYGWVLLSLALFVVMPARKAILFAIVGGTIVLPAKGMFVPGLPGVFDRAAAVVLPCLIGALLTDMRSFLRFRPVASDWAMLMLVLAPFASSLTNGLGYYDGISGIYRHGVTFGFPYLLGRLYFRDQQGIKALVVAICVSAILLAPLALWEIRMSPQLHSFVYGAAAVRFYMFSRFGGYRPIAFFPSPLMLTFALSVGTLCAYWLSRSARGSLLFGVRYTHWMLLLGLTTLLGKTFGAITLMFVGGGLLWITARTGRRWMLLGVTAFVFLYPGLRVTQILEAEPIVALIEPIFPESKVETLSYRLTQEDLYAQHTLERPWFGWGGWGRNRTRDTGSIDGLWIVIFSTYGIFGVGSLMGVFGIPVFRGLRKIPPRRLADPAFAPAAVLTVALFAFWIDCLANAFLNPLFVVGIGALAGWQPDREPSASAEETAPTTGTAEAAAGSKPPEPRFIDLKRRTTGLPRGGTS